MTTLFVRHQVDDFAKWKQVYDDFRPKQQQLGITAEAVYRAADNANDVTVMHEFATLEAAQQFMASDLLREAMQKAGVAGKPTIWFADKT